MDNPTHPKDSELPPHPAEPVWRFRGYQLQPSEFTTAMVHFYRGELSRSISWRTRLDNTTNWAVVTTGAALSFALADPSHHYGVLILDTLLVTLFLSIEARRYRYYELWSRRVRRGRIRRLLSAGLHRAHRYGLCRLWQRTRRSR